MIPDGPGEDPIIEKVADDALERVAPELTMLKPVTATGLSPPARNRQRRNALQRL